MKKLLLVLISLFLLAAGCTSNAVTNQSSSYKNITAKQLKQMLAKKDFLLIDVHVPRQPHIPQTDLSIPYDQIEQNAAKLPKNKNKKIVLYCAGGHMSQEAAQTLISMGYTNVFNLIWGAAGWRAEGYPLEP